MNEYQAPVRSPFGEHLTRQSPLTSNSDTGGALRTPTGRHALTHKLSVRERQSPGFARAREAQKPVVSDDQHQSLDDRMLVGATTNCAGRLQQDRHQR